MREIGEYIELDRFTGNMLYDVGVKLNRGTAAYVAERLDSFEQMIHLMDNSEEWCKVILA